MRIRYILGLLAAFAALASCEKEALRELEPESTYEQEPQVVRTVLQVGIGDTKTYLGDSEDNVRKVYWSKGNQVRANGILSDALPEDLPDNTSSVNFSFDGKLTLPYKVVYPESAYTDDTHINLPAIQTYKEGGIADNMLPLAGYSSSGSTISLSHLCAIVKISIKRASTDADTDKIATVRFRGRNEEKVSGIFEISDFETIPKLASESGSKTELEVRVNKSLETSTSEAVEYYLVVPAREYSNGFSIDVIDANGHKMTKQKMSSWTPEAGHLYKMPEFDFVPTSTELGVEIRSADDLITFATDYNNKVYASLGSSLVATITADADITFDETTSAAFNATKGIGLKESYYGDAEDYYFNGVFNGNNHSIRGLEATCPLFKATSASALIKDLTIDNTCSFTFTHSKAAELDAGAVVGYHRGTLSNVDVAADVSLAAVESVDKVTALGGLVGREVVGSVENNSSYSGNIVVPAGFQSSAQKIYIGGLVGEISNADGKVKNSSFTGTIDNQGQLVAASETTDFKNNPQLMIGGIIGLNTGSIDNCTVANHATGITVILSEHNLTGTVVTHSTNAYHYAIAGIAGRNDGTVSNCTNNATVLNIFSGGRGNSGNMNGRFSEISGIVGYNASGKTVSGCTNNGQIINRAVPKIQYVGGVVGRNFGTVSSCDNSSTGVITVGSAYCDSPDAARIPYIGGVIGCNESSAAISNVHNIANITVDKTEDAEGTIVVIGGIAGWSSAAIDGSANGGTITNSGNISYATANATKCSTPTAENDYGFYLGGIVGYATQAVKNASNSGTVTNTCNATGVGMQYVYLGGIVGKVKAALRVDVEKCNNSANVSFVANATYSDNNNTQYSYSYLGGIVGYAQNVAIKGDSSNKCTNSGIIKGGDNSGNKNTASTLWIGGIVGYLTGDSMADYCTLTGQANNDHWANRGSSATDAGFYDAPMCGGIVGQVVGTETSRIVVSNCTVASSATVTGRRGVTGGIIGASDYTDVSSCSVQVNVKSVEGASYWNGGIVALLRQSSVTDCNFSATQIGGSKISGGIVGRLDTGSSVVNCSSNATTFTASTYKGGIAGNSVEGTEIKKSHYKSSVNICGDSNFTAGTGEEANVADL